MYRKISFSVLAAFVALNIFAQTNENPWAIGLYVVKTEYLGDMRYRYGNVTTDNPTNTVFNFAQLYGGAALSLDRYLNRFFDAGIYISAGTLGYNGNPEKSTVYYSESINNFLISPLLNANIHTRIKFLGQNGDRVVPYVVLSAGALNYLSFKTKKQTTRTASQHLTGVTYNYTAENSDDFPAFAGIVGGGLGVEFKLNERFNIRYQAEAGWTTSDNNDLYAARKGNDWQLQHSLGLAYNFGKKIAKKEKPQIVEQVIEQQITKIDKEEPKIEIQPEPVVEQPKEEIKPEPKSETQQVEKEKMVVNHLLFELNKSELTNVSKSVLNEKMPELRETAVSILIKGHTDNTGNTTYNHKLSLQRANTVKNYLIANGVSPEKITVKGFGKTQPISPNDTAEGRAKNRRVEFVFGE